MTFRTDPFLCPDVEKISNFRPDVKNQNFSVRTLNFVLKSSTIGPIMHKKRNKTRKYEIKGCFLAPKVPKNFSAREGLRMQIFRKEWRWGCKFKTETRAEKHW